MLIISDLKISIVKLLTFNILMILLDLLLSYKYFIKDFRPFLFFVTYVVLYIRLVIYNLKQ
jgi:hypothetical protein